MADKEFTAALTPELELAKLSVMEKLDKIATGLKTHDPLIEYHCKAIRDSLQQHEELVHLLDDSQVRVLMQGMKSYVNTQLVKEASKSRGKGKITADDL